MSSFDSLVLLPPVAVMVMRKCKWPCNFFQNQSDANLQNFNQTSPDRLLSASKARGSLQVRHLSDPPAHWQDLGRRLMGEHNLLTHLGNRSSSSPLIPYQYPSKVEGSPSQEVVTQTPVPVPELEKQPTFFSMGPGQIQRLTPLRAQEGILMVSHADDAKYVNEKQNREEKQ